MASHQVEVHKEVVGAHKLKMEGPKTDVLAHRGHNDQCRLTMTRLIWQTLRLRMGKKMSKLYYVVGFNIICYERTVHLNVFIIQCFGFPV